MLALEEEEEEEREEEVEKVEATAGADAGATRPAVRPVVLPFLPNGVLPNGVLPSILFIELSTVLPSRVSRVDEAVAHAACAATALCGRTLSAVVCAVVSPA